MTTVMNPAASPAPAGIPGLQTATSEPQASGMQRSASQQLLIGQNEPDTPSMLIPVSATALIPATQGMVHPGLVLPGQGMSMEQVKLENISRQLA